MYIYYIPKNVYDYVYTYIYIYIHVCLWFFNIHICKMVHLWMIYDDLPQGKLTMWKINHFFMAIFLGKPFVLHVCANLPWGTH